jgi:hypothetical protein
VSTTASRSSTFAMPSETSRLLTATTPPSSTVTPVESEKEKESTTEYVQVYVLPASC